MSAESSVPPAGQTNCRTSEATTAPNGTAAAPSSPSSGERGALERGEQVVAQISQGVTGFASRFRSGVGGLFSRFKVEVGSIWDEAQHVRHGETLPPSPANPPAEPGVPKEQSR